MSLVCYVNVASSIMCDLLFVLPHLDSLSIHFYSYPYSLIILLPHILYTYLVLYVKLSVFNNSIVM